MDHFEVGDICLVGEVGQETGNTIRITRLNADGTQVYYETIKGRGVEKSDFGHRSRFAELLTFQYNDLETYKTPEPDPNFKPINNFNMLLGGN